MNARFFSWFVFRPCFSGGRLFLCRAYVILSILSAATSGCGRNREAAPLPVAVQVAALTNETVACQVRFSAVVREWQQVDLSFKVPGTVKDLLQVSVAGASLRDVQEGDVVHADPKQPLARLDDSDYQRQRTAAAERLAQVQAKEQAVVARLTAAENDYRRIKALSEQKSVSQQAMDEARARRDSIEAEQEGTRREIAEANVALQQADDDLQNCALSMPIPEATIARRLVEPHERVQAGQPVFQIMDLSRLRVAFGVPDTKLGEFQLGQTLKVLADAYPGESFAGHVTKIYPAADAKTRTFQIEVCIDRPRGLKPGMVVTILGGCDQSMVLLPLTSVQRGNRPDEFVVYAVGQERGRPTARRRRVQWDGVYDNRLRLVDGPASEVRVGDTVVVSGAVRLTDGQAVRVLSGEEGIL
jgi:RND family efflux transporter MFP subunit